MKKIFLFVIILFSLNASIIIAQTNVSGGLVSGIWTLAGSPYNIQGSLQIPNDSTLTIQPGVSIIFQGTYKLNVQGRLLAIGTATDTITFTATDTTNGWRGIRFDNTSVSNDSSKFLFCKLQYGKITGTSPNNNGGGLYFNNFSKVILSKCTISYCTATGSGGGIYCFGSSPIIINNLITKNRATTNASSEGGGIFCNASNPIISGNIISYNWASNAFGSGGGGISCNTSSPIITNNIISNNSGSGICCGSNGISPSAIINNNTIINNTAYIGGGICCGEYCNPTIINNTISNNTASDGGGIYCITNSSIINNNIISNNTASSKGGAIYYKLNSNATLYNNTFANNSAVNGGGIFCNETSSPIFRNCILWGNTASANGAQIYLNDEASDPDFYYCDIQGSSAAFELNGNMYTGTYQNNINSDPQFISPSVGSGSGFNGLSANWSLQITSPCIDAGDPNGTYPAIDIAGNPRVNVCRIDMGAYEYQTGIPFKVALNISQPILCNETATGEITAVVSGGTLPYTYLWSNGQTTANINGLVANNYSVTVSESSFGCTLIDSITISQPPADSIYAGTDKSIVCSSLVQLNAMPEWVTLHTGTTAQLFNSVYFTDNNTGYIAGSNGTILKTTDGGTSWNVQPSGTTNYLSSVFFTSADTGYVVGISGMILKTINGGTSWNMQTSGSTYRLNSIYFPNTNTGYAAGDGGTILKTSNGGVNWTLLTSGTTNYLTSVYFTNANTGYVVGSGGKILKTINGGTSWAVQTSGITSDLNSVYFAGVDTGYAVGGTGKVLKTTNGGSNWTIQVSGTTNDLFSVCFSDVNTGYAVGGGLIILRTSNGGTNWVVQYLSTGILETLESVCIPSSNKSYAVGYDHNYKAEVLKFSEPVAYLWTPSTGLNATNIPNPIANPAVATTYIVSAINENGCIAKDTVTVHVSPFSVNAGLNKTIICGGTAQFDNIVTNLDTSNYTGTYIYNWSPITGLNYDTIQNPIASVTSNTTYFVTVTTTNGCNAIDSVSVNVSPLTITGTGSVIICGDSTTILNTITNYTGTGALTYSWLPITGLDSSNVANPIATADSNQTYTVTVTTNNGCSATNDVSISVIPMNAPEICIVGVDSTNKNRIVWNKPVLTAIDSFYIYRETNSTNVYQKIGAISFDSLSVFVDINSYPDVQSNKYKISIQDKCGLQSNTSTAHKTMLLSINQGMGNTWNLIWEDYEGFTVSTYNVYRGTTPNNLQLIGSSSGSNTHYNDVTAPTGFLFYQVEVVSPNFCNPSKSYSSSRSNIAATQYAGINDYLAKGELFSIYPNPANEFITIDIAVFSNNYFFAEIFSMEGKLLKRAEISQKKTEINITDLPLGVYMIKLTGNNCVSINKLVKE